MKYKLIYPIGFYPPLLWAEELNEEDISNLSVSLLAFSNFLLRFIFYSFNFLINTVITVAAIVVATIFNLFWCLGGWLSEFWGYKTKQFNQIAITRCEWLIFDSFSFLWNQAKLLVGIFVPRYASKTIKMLHGLMHDLTDRISNHLDLQALHSKKFEGYLNF